MRRTVNFSMTAAWAFLLAAAAALWRSPVPPETDVFFGLIVCDPFSLAFRWLALARPAKRLREGTEILFAENQKSEPLRALVEAKRDGDYRGYTAG